MKKSVILISLLVLSLLVVGCVDYKEYEAPQEGEQEEAPAEGGDELVDEIAEIERELEEEAASDEEMEGEMVEGQEVASEEETGEETEPVSEEGEVLEEEEEVAEVEVESDGQMYVVRVQESDLVNLNPTVVDPDNDPVSWEFGDPLTAEGMWQTNYGDAGEYIIDLSATDGQLTTEEKIKLIVERVNVPPVIVDGVVDMVVDEGEVVRFEPRVEDPNGDAVTLEVSDPLRTGSFVTDHTSAGEYTIRVVASDGEMETVETFLLTVNDINVRPTITGVSDLVVDEGELVMLQPVVEDLDGDSVQVSISEPVGNDGEWQTDFTSHGEYFVTVTAEDGKDTVTQRVRILVQDVNKPPQIIDVDLEE